MSTKNVPASALRFDASVFELGDNGDGAKTAPFRMVARSGQPIEHWYWGKVVHDLSGMRLHKSRVPIDYAHDDREVIGYANVFNSESGDLEVSGALVPYKDSDRATEVIYKQKAGVPYEASINFGGDGVKVEQIAEGQVSQVNGYQFEGPGVIIREWPLRGIAVCPYGADMNTSTSFSGGSDNVSVEITEANMADEEVNGNEQQPLPEESQDSVEVQADSDSQPVEAPAEQVAVDAEATELSSRAAEGKRFLDAFGDKGAVWFAQGLTFAQASESYVAALKAENEQLRQRLSSQDSFGEQEPCSFSEAKTPPKKTRLVRIQGKKYED